MYKHRLLIVGVPVYNEQEFIKRTLTSLMEQSYRDFLVVISDNCSDDGTQTVCTNFIKNDHRFVYIRQKENIGAIGNFQFLYENTDSPYFMWLGGHDCIDDCYLLKQIATLNKNKYVGLVYSRVQWIDERDRSFRETDGGDFVRQESDGLYRYLNTIGRKWGECTAINGVFRRSVLLGVKFFGFSGPDHWILTRVQYFGKCYRTEEPIFKRREISNPNETYMERILGPKARIKSWRFACKMWPLALAQIQDYFTLPEPLFRKLVYFPLLLVKLERGYGLIIPFYYAIGVRACRFIKKRLKAIFGRGKFL